MISALLLAAVVASVPNQCLLCHPDVRVMFDRSRHHAEEVTCTACHGGNAQAITVEGAHGGGFRGVPKRRDIPALCATCHSNVEKMRPYNLPTDQFALYQTSRHGQLLAKGDERVAVCTDCHGSHEILPPEDPRSSTYVRNTPATCGKCHGDAKLMASYGLQGNPAAEFAAGVHGKLLLEKGNLAAPDCTRCHGAHGATPPGVGDVDKICGQCHATTRTYFLQGPHKAAMDQAGLPECAACHDRHDNLPADVGMLDKVCLNCHGADSAQVKLSLQMKTAYSRASEEIDQAHVLVQRAAAIPLYVEDYQARLEEARTALLESLPVMH
ncbi:MAG: cytochrome c3 family protein, partial [Acidobacteria bacterium]|nr:cytochrome c3 family protein [Acidobacteriota bacterium]